MIVTEKEASKIRCCGPENAGDDGVERSKKCIGSGCMAWRWVRKEGYMENTEKGYCGLAGPPN